MEDSYQQSSLYSSALIFFNDDLLTEILLRLPATSILRFKSVSKRWRRLLSDKSFTLRFDKLSKSPGMFVGSEYVSFDAEDLSHPPHFRSLDFYSHPCGIRILQSCNGLLLCCKDTSKRADYKYYVFNPTTKQFAIIPPVPGGWVVRNNIIAMAVAFHQTDCVQYKLVCVRALDFNWNLFQILVYSSDTREWKVSIKSFSSQGRIYDNGVYWNGAINWVTYRQYHLYYKIGVEELHSVPLHVDEMSLTRYMGECRGHLHLATIKYRNSRPIHLNVYEMLSYQSGWFSKCQLELDELLNSFPKMMIYNPYKYDSFTVVDVVRDEKDEDTFLVLLIHDKLVTYNLHDKSFKNIFDKYSLYLGSSPCHRYIEALASF